MEAEDQLVRHFGGCDVGDRDARGGGGIVARRDRVCEPARIRMSGGGGGYSVGAARGHGRSAGRGGDGGLHGDVYRAEDWDVSGRGVALFGRISGARDWFAGGARGGSGEGTSLLV